MHIPQNLQIYGNKKAKKTKTADGRTTYWDPKSPNLNYILSKKYNSTNK